MKKIISVLLVLVMCVSLGACGEEKEKPAETTETAFEVSKEAYDSVATAYEITEQFASDLYEAWRLGIYEDDTLTGYSVNAVTFLASELSLSEDEIVAGVAAVTEMSNMTKDRADTYFVIYEDQLFSFCVKVVTAAYTANGKVQEAQDALDAAKENMKQLSEKYADYEHYPTLKEYYTATSSFFDFCQNPTGSFEQVKTTINDYKNEIRNHISDLDYIFEE